MSLRTSLSYAKLCGRFQKLESCLNNNKKAYNWHAFLDCEISSKSRWEDYFPLVDLQKSIQFGGVFFCSVGSNIFKHQSRKKMHRTRLCHPYSLWVPSAACKPRIQLSYLWSDILLSMRKHWSPTGWWSKVTFVSIFSHYPEELFKHSSSTALNKSTG